MQRNAPAHKKPIRRADDLVPFVGACMDCRYRIGDAPVTWRCGALGGRYTEVVRTRGEPCPHWQPRTIVAGVRATLPLLSFWLVVACLFAACVVAVTRCDGSSVRELRYNTCLDQGHGPAACGPILHGEETR